MMRSLALICVLLLQFAWIGYSYLDIPRRLAEAPKLLLPCKYEPINSQSTSGKLSLFFVASQWDMGEGMRVEPYSNFWDADDLMLVESDELLAYQREALFETGYKQPCSTRPYQFYKKDDAKPLPSFSQPSKKRKDAHVFSLYGGRGESHWFFTYHQRLGVYAYFNQSGRFTRLDESRQAAPLSGEYAVMLHQGYQGSLLIKPFVHQDKIKLSIVPQSAREWNYSPSKEASSLPELGYDESFMVEFAIMNRQLTPLRILPEIHTLSPATETSLQESHE